MVILLLLCAILGAAGRLPFKGSNVSDLSVTEILCFRQEGDEIVASCDGDLSARGETMAQAIEQLHAAAPGELFLGTVDFAVFTGVEPEPRVLLEAGLRPAVSLYRAPNVEDPAALAKYLRHHGGGCTLGMLEEDGALMLPRLQQGESGLVLQKGT